MGSRQRDNRREGTGNKEYEIGRYKIDRGGEDSMGNGESKELICTTHGQELSREDAAGRGSAGWRVIKGKNMGQL